MSATTMKLKTLLTRAEVDAKQKQIVKLLGEVEELDRERKEVAKRLRDQIKVKGDRIEALRREIEAGEELREVKVEAEYSRTHVTIIRKDTGEVVTRRKLTKSERSRR